MREIKHRSEVRPRKDHRGVNLISDTVRLGRLWGDRDERAEGRFQRVLIAIYVREAPSIIK